MPLLELLEFNSEKNFQVLISKFLSFLDELKTHNDIYCEKYQKNGETYLRIKKYVVKFSPSRVTLQFDNLFEGDSILGT